jgi:ferrochelatase
VIFTAHSLPLAYATGSPYARQLEETIEGIISITGPVRRRLAFQSRTGGREQWLGPDPEKILEELSQEGRRKVLICPIGFIADHLETLYDLDIALKGWAAEQGIDVIRTPCLNDAPDLIGLLAHLVEEALPKQ